MTITSILSNAKYVAALKRADMDGIVIVDKLYASGVFCGWAVQSRRATCYIVRQDGMTLTCSCKASANGQYCKHRAVVTRRLMEEAAIVATAVQEENMNTSIATEDVTGTCTTCGGVLIWFSADDVTNDDGVPLGWLDIEACINCGHEYRRKWIKYAEYATTSTPVTTLTDAQRDASVMIRNDTGCRFMR